MRMGGRRAAGTTMALGVLVGGMALGVSTAAAETPYCVSGGHHYTGSLVVSTGDECVLPLSELTELPDPTTDPPATETTPEDTSPSSSPLPLPLPLDPINQLPIGPSKGSDPTQNGPQSPAGSANNGPASQAPVLAAPVPAALGPAATAAAALGAAPVAGLPTDLTGSPYAPALMASGFYDPSLLLSPGAPAPGLQSLSPASGVMSASQIQAMALNAPASLGIGATVGVVILAGLGGLVLRHRIRRRVAKAASAS